MSTTIEEISTDARDQAKKIEENIVAQINKYNEEIKDTEVKENLLHRLQSKAYTLSEKYRKLSKHDKSNPELGEIEAELASLDTEIDLAQTSLLDAKHIALVSIQALYKEHVDYLSQIANGLKNRCDQLEEKLSKSSKLDINGMAAAALSSPAAPVSIQQAAPMPAPVKQAAKKTRKDNVKQ